MKIYGKNGHLAGCQSNSTCIAYVKARPSTCIPGNLRLFELVDLGLLLLNTFLKAVEALNKFRPVFWGVEESSMHLVQLLLCVKESLLLGVDHVRSIEWGQVEIMRGLGDDERGIAVTLRV